jgi:hypothetical protein
MTDIASLLREAAEVLKLDEKAVAAIAITDIDSYIDGLAERLEAAAEAMPEAVAWISDELLAGKCVGVMAYRDRKSDDQVPVYLAPQAAVPDGWKLVPVEPTDEICEVMEDCMRDYGYHPDDIGEFDKAGCYKAMLSAAGDSHHE